jgi:hypothetical protein
MIQEFRPVREVGDMKIQVHLTKDSLFDLLLLIHKTSKEEEICEVLPQTGG